MSDALLGRLRASSGSCGDRHTFLNNPDGPAAADEITRLRATLAERDAELAVLKHDIARHVSICADQQAEIERLNGLVYAPGLWRCAKCNFTLIQKNLNVDTGTVTARDDTGDKCPNCASPLWRVSERESAHELGETAERFWSEAQDLKAEIAALKNKLFDEQMNGDAIRIIREPLKRVGIASAFAIDLGALAACEIERLRAERDAEVAALKAEREWKPWDTAPPDIAKGLVYYPQFYCVEAATCIIYAQDEGEAIGVARATLDLDGGQWVPTHWQPLPPAPEAT